MRRVEQQTGQGRIIVWHHKACQAGRCKGIQQLCDVRALADLQERCLPASSNVCADLDGQ